jgi:hypothetical protein
VSAQMRPIVVPTTSKATIAASRRESAVW